MRSEMADGPAAKEWISIQRDQETGIETIRAHFTGHAYDPHDHDDYLVGVTEQGFQEFHCRHRLHTSTPGRVILIEPGEVHDGYSAQMGGYTYSMMYLPQALVSRLLVSLGPRHASGGLHFASTLRDDAGLAGAILSAFRAYRGGEGRLARDLRLDRLLLQLAGHPLESHERTSGPLPPVVRRARDVLHAHLADDLGIDDLAALVGLDRFQLSRAFRRHLGLSPHAYLVQLRLKLARRLLSGGWSPADTAAEVGFADQSHLGRWFRRAYRVTPAAYRSACTNVPDPSRRLLR